MYDEWRTPMKGDPNVFKAIRITYQDGSEELLLPDDGKHVLLMTWAEIEKSQSEEPGMMLFHTDTEISAKMIARLFRKFPAVWYNIQKLWAVNEAVETAERMRQAARADRIVGKTTH